MNRPLRCMTGRSFRSVRPDAVSVHGYPAPMDPLVAGAVIAATASVLTAAIGFAGVAGGAYLQHRLRKAGDQGDRLSMWQLDRLRDLRSFFVATFAMWDAIATGSAKGAEEAGAQFERYRFENVRLVGRPEAITAWQEYITRSHHMIGRSHLLEDQKYLGSRMHIVLSALDEQELTVMRGRPIHVITDNEMDAVFDADAWAQEMRMPNVSPSLTGVIARFALDGMWRFRRPPSDADHTAGPPV